MRTDSHAPSPEGAPQAGVAASPLGSRIAHAVLDRSESCEELVAFLEDAPLAALRRWFGERADTLLADDPPRLRAALDRDIAAIDTLLAAQVEAILHHRSFQALEASWRGLQGLIDASDGDERVVIRVMSATWGELVRDFRRAAEFDRSVLFERLYSDEFGMPGGLPYGLVLCDYEVQHRHGGAGAGDDISTLSALAGVASAAFAPCIIGASPALLGVGDFAELSFAQDLTLPLRSAEYTRWRGLQAQSDSRFLGITAPRVLVRAPHGDSGARTDGFRFDEGTGGMRRDDWLWGTAVYGFGAVVMHAFRDWGWFADIRGTRLDQSGAGLLEHLPAAPFSTGEPEAYRRGLEVELTDRKQKQMEEMGLIALSPCRYTPNAAFLGAPSLHVPPVAGTQEHAANERISSMLQYILCVSRFAHYVKVIGRDVVGALTTAEELQRRLNTWIQQYVTGNTDASDDLKARFPLNSSSVEIRDVIGKPGAFSCVLHLKPHFQIDQMVASFRLSTELSGPRAG